MYGPDAGGWVDVVEACGLSFVTACFLTEIENKVIG